MKCQDTRLMFKGLCAQFVHTLCRKHPPDGLHGALPKTVALPPLNVCNMLFPATGSLSEDFWRLLDMSSSASVASLLALGDYDQVGCLDAPVESGCCTENASTMLCVCVCVAKYRDAPTICRLRTLLLASEAIGHCCVVHCFELLVNQVAFCNAD